VKVTLAVRNEWTSDWDSNWFYCRVPSEEVADVRGKGNYPLSSMMTQLNHLIGTLFECGPGDTNVTSFIEAASIIRGRNAVDGFLSYGIWPLSEKCDFEVEIKETPLLKVVVLMWKVPPFIGTQESEAAFKAWIVTAANLLVGNYNVTEHNAYKGLRHG
jgi:hypothetical protein